jgi:hypothetical protein
MLLKDWRQKIKKKFGGLKNSSIFVEIKNVETMNTIKQLFSDLSDEELILTINEIKESDVTGIFPDNSNVRALCQESARITKMDVSSNLLMVQINVLKEGSYRWLDCRTILENGHI